MTLLKPTLFINTLEVYKGKNVALSLNFHKGVNIISGQNSAGKTTILDFIAYALGAENIPWKPEALSCDYSIAELYLNECVVTIRREINSKPMNPLYVFWGSMDMAVASPFSAWEVFPFRRSAERISFTQALLLALDLPEAQGDGASNLTMHQFLRVMYADQPSLHSPIFRTDTFDSALTREAVGSYLCGIFDDDLYSLQLERRALEKQISQLDAEVKSIYVVLAKSEQSAGLEFLTSAISKAEEERDTLTTQLGNLKVERVTHSKAKTGDDTELRKQLDQAKASLTANLDAIARADLDMADTLNFMVEIKRRVVELSDSQSAREYFNGMSFAFCPCCLSQLSSPSPGSNECGLCKTPLGGSAGDSQLLRMKNELQIQLRESEAILADKTKQVTKLNAGLPELRQTLRTLEKKYNASSKIWSSEVEIELERISRRIGTIDQEIKGLHQMLRLASAIRDLVSRRDAAKNRLTDIDSSIEKLVFAQEERKKVVALEISSTLARLLRKDLPRQEHFMRAQSIEVNFTDNTIAVEGATQFSESSMVVLRHLLHLALLTTADRVPAMRFARFLMLDGIEDGGMELERSHHLQQIIIDECQQYQHDYQLIFATSQISPKFNIPALVVSRTLTKEQKSLTVKSAIPSLLTSAQ